MIVLIPIARKRVKRSASPPAGSAAAEFLDLLRKQDPVQELRSRVVSYRAEVRQTDRSQLFKRLVQSRKDLLAHPMFKCLKEFDALFALPAPVDVQCD